VLIFLDRYLKGGRCTSCGDEFDNRENLLNVYLHDAFERFLSKPLRVYQEVEHWPPPRKKQLSTYTKLIKRAFGKPTRELQNLGQIWKRSDFGEQNETHANL
jgi:hypothetical protein